jgi:uncharacterized damage-inducible protein DinB
MSTPSTQPEAGKMIGQMLLPEFDQEMASTRKTLERVPDDKFGWKPHEKSFALGALANHVATIPFWAVMTFQVDSLDIQPPGGEEMKEPKADNREELLALFDKNAADARAALASATDAQFMEPWSLLAAGRTLFTMPRYAVYRGMVMNHLVHHRAQLAVYFRLNDIPVPALYGPSADEQSF